jgi:hypothetical protein
VIAREAQGAPDRQPHRAQASQAGTCQEKRGPRVREQEHRTHSRATDAERSGKDQQSDEFVAPHLARGRGQDERQVEEGVAVEDNRHRNHDPDGPEREQAEERVETECDGRVHGGDEQQARSPEEREQGVNEEHDERLDAFMRAFRQQYLDRADEQGQGTLPPPGGECENPGAENSDRERAEEEYPERIAQLQRHERQDSQEGYDRHEVHRLVHGHRRERLADRDPVRSPQQQAHGDLAAANR